MTATTKIAIAAGVIVAGILGYKYVWPKLDSNPNSPDRPANAGGSNLLDATVARFRREMPWISAEMAMAMAKQAVSTTATEQYNGPNANPVGDVVHTVNTAIETVKKAEDAWNTVSNWFGGM